MIYLTSDIHGCYDKYIALLQKINLQEGDILYILGDVVDRGPQGMKILLDIARRENIILLRGNHDQEATILLEQLIAKDNDAMLKQLAPLIQLWLSDGGEATLKEFLALGDAEQETVLDVIRNSLISKEIIIDGQKYLLAHTVPEIEKLSDYEKWTINDYLMGEPDYEQVYFKDKVIITGHTPTGFIDSRHKGKIWKGNHHIAIDCGAVFGNSLGCICLDTLEEFYV